MASLTQVSIAARKTIRFGIYITIFIILARYSIIASIALYRKYFPKPPPPPTVGFGKLPKLIFPDKPIPENLSFKLETADGSLPKFIDQLPVFTMPIASTNIRALEDAKVKAGMLGFRAEDGFNIIQSIPNVFIFRKPNSSSLLTINIITGIYSISYDLTSDTSILTTRPQSTEISINQAKEFLQDGNSYPADLSGDVITDLLRVDKGQLVPAISLSESNFAKVNFFRKKFIYREIEFPNVTADYPEANVWLMTNGNRIIAGEFHYFPLDELKFETYPLISSQEAWDRLNLKNAYFANLGNNPDGNITIRKVYVAHYDAGQYVKYYQPVAVFEGDNGFFAFLPAVTDEYYGDQ